MRDDQQFNIYFVKLVEANPCLYDNMREDYNTLAQEKTWAKISEEIGDGVTIQECKRRWKHLRGNYTRHVRLNLSSGPEESAKRGYYLAKYLSFLTPFIKIRKPFENFEASKDSLDPFDGFVSEEYEIEELSNSNDNDEVNKNSTRQRKDCDEESAVSDEVSQNSKPENKRGLSDPSVMINEPKRNRIAHEHVAEYFEEKKQLQYEPSSIYFDPDAQFLLSLLPDMKQMTDKQKRRYKVGIIKLADQILDEPVTSHVSAHIYSFACESHSPSLADNLKTDGGDQSIGCQIKYENDD